MFTGSHWLGQMLKSLETPWERSAVCTILLLIIFILILIILFISVLHRPPQAWYPGHWILLMVGR